MFGLNWFNGSAIAAGVVAAAIMFGLWQNAKGDVKTANAKVAALTAQKKELQDNIKDLQTQLKFKDDTQKLNDDANAGVKPPLAVVDERNAKERNDAVSETLCGPGAAPVLEYAANSMRRTRARIAGYIESAGLSGNITANRSDLDPPAARGSWPTKQCEFGQAGIDWADYAEKLVIKLASLPAWQTAYNARVRATNAGATNGH